MVAAARAVATRQPHAIINDPWAAPLVEAVGIESLSRMVQLGTPPADAGLGSDLRLQPMIDSFAVRTRFFDEFFTAAMNSGIRQVVILAAGLDSRAYRLPWPHGTVIYEVDLPSAPRSQLATEDHPDVLAEVSRRTASDVRWKVNGIDIDTAGLVYIGERHSARNYLAAHGWSVAEQTRVSLFEEYGLSAPEDGEPMRNVVAVTAHLD